MQETDDDKSIIDRIIAKLPTSFVSIILLFVALGNFNDSFEVINRFYEFGYSLFSNRVYYERIDRVKVGLNAKYLEDTLGEPHLIKRLQQENDAQYYFENDFMLVVFEREGRIEGFYVIAFDESFAPNINLNSETEQDLWTASFDSVTPSTDVIFYDFSKNNSYYLESTEVRYNGLELNIYLGWTSVANKSIDQELFRKIQTIVELEMLEDEKLFDEIIEFRAAYSPNFYGYGNVSADLIEESLLTNSELLFYAGIN